MKKILQKSYAWLVMLVAMFAVSGSAMAESVTFYFTYEFLENHSWGYNMKVGDVILRGTNYDWDTNVTLWDDEGWGEVHVTPEDGFKITRVEFVGAAYAGIYEKNSIGSCASSSTGSLWTGESVGELVFGSSNGTSDNPELFSQVIVTYEEGGPVSTTFTFSSSSIADGDIYNEPINASQGLNLYHNFDSMDFAEGKTKGDITINGNPLNEDVSVNFWYHQIWISYAFDKDGVNTISIPEGVFVNEKGRTNEPVTINFTIDLPGFSMSAAEWTTFGDNKPWKMPEGYEGYIVSDIVDGAAILTKEYPAGTTVSENLGVIINGPQADKILIEHKSYVARPLNYLYYNAENFDRTFWCDEMYMYEPFAGMFNYGFENCILYKLSYDSNGENLGFYWDASNGMSVNCPSHKAFLVVPESKHTPSAGSNGLKIRFEEDVVTGISSLATESNDAIFNLQGQRVNATAAGVYVKNGKKFIVK